MSDPAVLIAVVSSLLTCYFTAVHTALRTYARGKVLDLAGQRGWAERAPAFLDQEHQLALMTATVRTLLNFAVLLSMLHISQEKLTGPWWHAYLAALAAAGALVMVFGVAIPASWARYRAEALLVWSMGPLTVCMKLLWPVVAVLHLFDPVVRRVSGAELDRDSEDHVSNEVLSVVEEHESEGGVDSDQREMIEAVFDLSKTTAGEVMTPRTDIEGIELDLPLPEVVQKVMEFGHSRIPVYTDSIDNIHGILYVKDLIRFIGAPEAARFSLKQVIRPAQMVPETKPLRELLAEFKDRKVHIAIVLDEYGGTAGLVTIEDILEELVGDIQDEYEPTEEEPTLNLVDENTAEVDGRMYIDDLNDQFKLSLPEDEDYDTVGGFVFSTLGHVPAVGESFEYDGTRITVTGAERTRVTSVRIERLVVPADSSEAQTPVGEG